MFSFAHFGRVTTPRTSRIRGRRHVQGLTTNDIDELSPDKPVQYNMLLNLKGRVLYDLLIYRHKGLGCMLECDSESTSGVIKHLRKYMLRSKVTAKDVSNEYSVMAGHSSLLEDNGQSILVGNQDPRVKQLGVRVVVFKSDRDKLSRNTLEMSLDSYHQQRMLLGVAEGAREILPENALPFEFNLDYMNGVGFSKGCYLGQELVARSYHVGVIRKRLLPVTISDISDSDAVDNGAKCYDESGKLVGKFVTRQGSLGLAILRITDIGEKQIMVTTNNGDKVTLHPTIPQWWPSTSK
ncbi:putative transferase CAF17, mitochondrial isoform X2 [Dysidea avara]|uniref:putative transferase CAF17, mitochondrial isoform X2 n=1 Tax=Dysidea avara TaxID=196820 RepID=UPI003320B681